MEGLVVIVALVIALVLVVRLVVSRKPARQKEPQSTEPPGRRTAPDEWPRDGGDNPRSP